jgi:hypothetical protein
MSARGTKRTKQKLVGQSRVRIVDGWCLIDGFRCLMRKI